MIIAIIPAAGKGIRLKESLPKQFIEIKGVPILVRTILKFENHPQVKGIIISVSPFYKSLIQDFIKKFNITKVINIVEGGETRQKSVYKGVIASPKETEIFLVHDAVRPFVSGEIITKVIEATYKYEIAVPVIPVRDTLSYVEDDLIKKHVKRNNLFHIQTPQGIKAELLLKCLKKAEEEGMNFPDESSLLTYYGYKVFTVEGSFINFKITFKEDLILAEKLIDCKIEESIFSL